MPKNKTEKRSHIGHRVLTVIGTILCIILLPILIINCTLIAKSYLNKDEVPSVGGVLPLIVLTDSMYPVIHSGDLIICHTEEPENIKVGDIIAFFDPASKNNSIVTHRVTEIVDYNDGIAWKTKGDNNNTEDMLAVLPEELVAVYRTRIPGAGNIAMFMQTTAGLIVCVVLPFILLVGYDLIRRRIYDRKKQEDTDALLAELEALRAQKAQKEQE